MTAVLATRRIRDLPGPPGLPVLGNLLQIDSTRLHLIAEEWSRTYGDCFRFRIGRREFLVLANPEAIASVLRDRPEGFQRTSRLSSTAKEMGFGGVFSSNGEQWRRQRPMVMAGFDPAHIKSYFPALVRVTQRFCARWERAAAAGTAIDLQADLMRYTVDVTAGLAFGVDINTLESEEEVIQTHLDKVLPALFRRLMAPFPYWRYLRLPGYRRTARHLEELHRAVEGFIVKARLRMERDPSLRARPTNLIEAMIAARDTEGSGLDDADVSGNVLTMLLAGEDTTANTLSWIIYLLGCNPAAMQRARDEVRGVIAAQPFPQHYEQMSKLAFVEACAHETMRLKPVAPLIMAEAVRDTVIAGIEVPARQLVMCLMRPGATDERHFPAALAFDPARWLADATTPRAASSAKRVAMPFGAGPRLCPGRYLAMLEMKMVIAMLLASFEVESVSAPGGAEVREHLALTMAPVGLRLRLRPRALALH
ncbi:MAG TPA: cytochrome P450 [Burkholderiales bacterium]|nr:cytochrome P450 [Burkholderiales bacterium]